MWCEEKIICGELDIIFYFHKFTTMFIYLPKYIVLLEIVKDEQYFFKTIIIREWNTTKHAVSKNKFMFNLPPKTYN